MKSIRRFLALLLAFSMSLSMVTPAFASEVETVAETEAEAAVIETEAVEATEAPAEETEAEAPEAPAETEAVVETEAVIEPVQEDAAGSAEEALTELGWYYPTLDENGQYTYTYTAVGEGAITMYLAADIEGDITATVGDKTYVLSVDGVDNNGLEMYVAVAEGDLVTIVISGAANAESGWFAEMVYTLGTQNNPIYPEFQWNDAQTEATATVTAPVGTTWYAVYGGGMMLSINGGEAITLVAQGMGRTPALFSITNDGEAEAEYSLRLFYPVGTRTNPEAIESLVNGGGYAELAEGSYEGYFYTYTAEGTGYITLAPSFVTEGVEVDIVVMNDATYAQSSLLNEGVNGMLTVAVTEGETFTINMVALPDANYNYPAAEIGWTGSFSTEAPGSEANPYNISSLLVWNEAQTEATATVTVEAGVTAYFAVKSAAGMDLYIDDTFVMVLGGNFFTPATFTITNEGTEAATYALRIGHPTGTQMNPEVIESLVNGGGYAELEAGNNMGYFYTYTAEGTGYITLAPSFVTEGVEVDIVVMNNNTYAQVSLVNDAVNGVLAVPVTEGESFTINMVAMPDANWNYPAAEIGWTGSFSTDAPGSEANPYNISSLLVWNEAQTEATTTVTVEAGATVYFAVKSAAGLELYVNDVYNTVLGGDFFTPAVFSITNEGTEAASYVVKIAHPAGTQMNPEVIESLVNGGGYAELEAGNSMGYFYTYTAEGTGYISFAPSFVTEGVEIDIVVMNDDTYAQVSLVNDAVNGVLAVPVTEGETFTITMVAMPDASWNYPAAEIGWTGSFSTDAPGSEANPYNISSLLVWNEKQSEATATVTVEAGATAYFAVKSASGMDLYIDDAFVTVLGGNFFTPATFTITNEGTEAAAYSIKISHRVGTQMNPEVIESLVNGGGYAELEAGNSMGYFYTYTAEGTGYITLAPSFVTEGVEVDIVVMNDNTYAQVSLAYDAVNGVLAVPVTEGETFTITMVAMPDASWNYPAAEIGWTGSFSTDAPGSEANPYNISSLLVWNEKQSEATTTVTVAAGATAYFAVRNASGMELYVDETFVSVLAGDFFTPATFTITNDGTEAAEYAVKIMHPLGSQMNPEMLYYLRYFQANLEAGDSDGYYYTFMASEPGTVVLNSTAIEGVDFDVVITHMGSYAQASMAENGDYSVSMPVEAGDELLIQVVAIPDAAFNYPAASVTVTGSFIYPVGHQQNPEVLEYLGGYATIEEGDTDGYYYVYTAEATGYLNASITYTTENVVSDIVLMNNNTWQNRGMLADGVNGTVTLAVTEGDEIIINVANMPDEDWNYPAGEIGWTASISTELPGTEATPYDITNLMVWNEKQTEMTATVTVAANSSAVFAVSRVGGMELYIDGEFISVLEGSFFAPTLFTITNDGDETATYEIRIMHPVGSMGNPVEMILGKKNTAQIAEGCQGYFYTWTATGNGVLEFTMNSTKNWTYQVINETTYGSTDTYTSADETVVKKGYVAVSKGDEISIMVNTFDAENPWSAPAGKVEFTPKLIVSHTDTMLAGKSMTLKYLDATGKNVMASKVTWSELVYEDGTPVPADVATLKAGKLTAAKTVAKATTVCTTGTYNDVTKYFTVTIYPAATAVTIYADGEATTSKTTLTLDFNDSANWPVLTAAVTPAEAQQEITWKTSNAKIVDVVDGKLIPVAAKGNATITATANDGTNKKATIKVTIVKAPTEVQMPSKAVIAAGKTLTLTPEILEADATNKKLTWTFGDAELATTLGLNVSNGKVTTNAKKLTAYLEETGLGYATIEVTATAVLAQANGTQAADTTTVMIFPATTSVALYNNGEAQKTIDMVSGDEIVLYAEGAPANSANRFSWATSNEDVASIVENEDGSVTVKAYALKKAKATITATAVDGTNKKATVTINVIPDVDMLWLNAATVAGGGSINMNTKLVYADENENGVEVVTPVSKNLTWTLSLADYSDGTGNPTFVPCENNECYAGKLDAKTGVFKAAKVTEAAFCFATATYTNEAGEQIVSNGVTIAVTPKALKGINVFGSEGEWNEETAVKVNGKTVTTNRGIYYLKLTPTNPASDNVYYMPNAFVDDAENFKCEFVGDSCWAISPVDDGDPEGTVTVNLSAEGGATKKATVKITFEGAPLAE